MTTHTTPTEQHTTPTAPATAALTRAHDQIWHALNDQPGATAAMLAQATRIGRSTAAKALAAMEKDGLARREPGTPDGNRRVASHWYPNQPTQPETNSRRGGQPARRSHRARHPAHRRRRSPGSRRGPHPRQASSRDRSRAARARTANADRDHRRRQAATRTRHAAPDGAQPPTGPPQRGVHRTALSRVIGKSSGAIANALVTLEKNGQARQVNDHPRKYQLRTGVEQ